MDIADTHKKSQYLFPLSEPARNLSLWRAGPKSRWEVRNFFGLRIQGLSYPILLHCHRVKKFLVQLVSTVISKEDM